MASSWATNAAEGTEQPLPPSRQTNRNAGTGKVPALCVAEKRLTPHHGTELNICCLRYFGGNKQEVHMPIFILWAGIPILILGGGFVVYRIIGG
jgi:hypothetical protein